MSTSPDSIRKTEDALLVILDDLTGLNTFIISNEYNIQKITVFKVIPREKGVKIKCTICLKCNRTQSLKSRPES